MARQPLAALGLALLPVLLFPIPALGQGPAVTIKSVRLIPSPAGPVVTIEADGPLPEPVMGEVDGPPRVFLDFAGVRTTARSVTQSVDMVKRVRVALHNASPPSTRVVLDLDRQQPVRLDTSARGAGRLTIFVGAAPAAAPAAAQTVPPPPPIPIPPPAAPAASTPPVSKPLEQPGGKPATPAPATDVPLKPVPPLGPANPPATAAAPPPVTTTPPPPVTAPDPPSRPPAPAPKPSVAKIPQRDADRYREQVGQPLERLRSMRALLVAVDQQQPLPSVTANRSEISAILRTLTAARPSDAVKSIHDLLVRSASLALMALTLRDTPAGEAPDQESLRNAASAAAGALLLLDRVCMEIGCAAAEAD